MTYACREYARRAVDVLARRTRLAFLNVPAAEEVLPRVIEIMAHELGWSKAKQKVRLSLSGGLARFALWRLQFSTTGNVHVGSDDTVMEPMVQIIYAFKEY